MIDIYYETDYSTILALRKTLDKIGPEMQVAYAHLRNFRADGNTMHLSFMEDHLREVERLHELASESAWDL